LQLAHDTTARQCHPLKIWIVLQHLPVRTHRGIASLSLCETSIALEFAELAQEIVLVLLEDAVMIQERLHGRIGDALRMKLLIDPGVEADRPDSLNISRARAKSEPVESVYDLLVSGELPVIERRLRHCGNGDSTC
jgi:hypothetical protein